MIDKTGASVLAQVIGAWVSLFECGPDPLVLTGQYSTAENPDGAYEKLTYDKRTLLEALKTLIEFARKVEYGGYVIIHIGI